eukprot:TRINITY_DN11093_c0_g1_i1.p1 TRINITY_DN11093_c0_g1~~TRINITY_DN11093_c0_g1_i1.p1  ORF type:complete len:665 (+),score=96.47 TRINITY_DN11093_c0_g1_i1:67-2061(+)
MLSKSQVELPSICLPNFHQYRPALPTKIIPLFLPFHSLSIFFSCKTQHLNCRQLTSTPVRCHVSPIFISQVRKPKHPIECLLQHLEDNSITSICSLDDRYDLIGFIEEYQGDGDANETVFSPIWKTSKEFWTQNALADYLKPYVHRLSSRDCNYLLASVAEAGLYGETLDIFQWIRAQRPSLVTPGTYSLLFLVIGKAGMAQKLWELFTEMPEEEAAYNHAHVFNALIWGFSECSRYDDAWRILKEMERRSIKPNSSTCSFLVTVINKSGQNAKEVWELFEKLFDNREQLSSNIFDSLIKIFCDGGLIKEALIILSEMESRGCIPCVSIYNSIICAFLKANQLQQAEGLFLEMKQRHSQPTTLIYNTLIEAYSVKGLYNVVEGLIKEMENFGLPPDIHTYTSLITAYGMRKNKSDNAASAFCQMRLQGFHPTSDTYTAMIRAYCNAGYIVKAQCMLANMLKEGLRPSTGTFAVLLNHYKRSGDTQNLRKVWESMMKIGLNGTREIYNILVDGFARKGNFYEVKHVIRRFKKMEIMPDVMTYNMLIKAYAVGERPKMCTQVLKHMKAAGLDPDSSTYSILVYGFFKNCNYRKAYYYYGQMVKYYQVSNSKSDARMKAFLDLKKAVKRESEKRILLKKLHKMSSLNKTRQSKVFWKNRKVKTRSAT